MSVVVKDDKKKVVVVVPKIEVNQTIEHNGTWGEIEGELDDQSDLMSKLDTKENKNRTILESDNFDEVTANGKYSASYGAIMLDVANAYGQIFQRAVYQATNTEKFRWQTGGEWSAWVTLTGKMDKEPTIMPSGSSYDDLTENGVFVDSNFEAFLHVSNRGGFILQIQHNVYNGTSFRMTIEGGVFGDWQPLVTLAQLESKVDKVNGKGLSTNDYTENEKQKLAGIEAGAQVNVPTDWDGGTGYMPILNKPNNFPPSAHNHTHNDLAGLNDGDYKHLTADEYTTIKPLTNQPAPTTATVGWLGQVVFDVAGNEWKLNKIRGGLYYWALADGDCYPADNVEYYHRWDSLLDKPVYKQKITGITAATGGYVLSGVITLHKIISISGTIHRADAPQSYYYFSSSSYALPSYDVATSKFRVLTPNASAVNSIPYDTYAFYAKDAPT